MSEYENCNTVPGWFLLFVAVLAVVLMLISIIAIVEIGIPNLQESTILAEPLSVPVVSATRTSAPTPTDVSVLALDPTSVVTDARFTATPVADTAISQGVESLISRINSERAANGSSPLSSNSMLMTAAQVAANEAAQNNGTVADISMHIAASGYLLAATCALTYQGTLDMANDVWLTDPGIHTKLLDPTFSEIGVNESDDQNWMVLILSKPEPLTAPGASVNLVGIETQTGQAQTILELLNSARQAQGLSALVPNPILTQAAMNHSLDQAAHITMTHTGSDGSQVSDRVQTVGYSMRMVGENVLMRGNIHASAAFNQWWNSPPHYENMMNAGFEEIGLAYAPGDDGNYYYTMVLGTPQS